MSVSNSVEMAAKLAKADRTKMVKRKKRRANFTAFLFLAPYTVLLLMFGVVPITYAFGMSFFDTIDGVFWGLTNYWVALDDYRLGDSIFNILHFVAIWVTVTICTVTALSLMLDAVGRRLSIFLRTVYFLPGAITSSAVVVLWLFLLDPLVSPFQVIFDAFGWESRQETMSGIGNAGAFALMAFMAHSGGWIVVMGGALSSLSSEIIDASRVDGANLFQQAIRVKLPMIWRSISLMGILTFAAGLQIFVEPQLMRMAGPIYARDDWSVNQLAFQYAFSFGDFGVAAALSTMLLAICMAIALVLIFATKFYHIK